MKYICIDTLTAKVVPFIDACGRAWESLEGFNLAVKTAHARSRVARVTNVHQQPTEVESRMVTQRPHNRDCKIAVNFWPDAYIISMLIKMPGQNFTYF